MWVEGVVSKDLSVELAVAAGRARITAFRGSTSSPPALLLNYVAHQAQFRIFKRLFAFQKKPTFSRISADLGVALLLASVSSLRAS